MKIYFHSRRRLFSIVQKGKVVGHVPCITLKNARFIVNEAGRERVRREKRKNVHAYIMGEPTAYVVDRSVCKTVWYNPYVTDFFSSVDGPVFEAKLVYCEVINKKPALWILES